jgi:hypothetical protein
LIKEEKKIKDNLSTNHPSTTGQVCNQGKKQEEKVKKTFATVNMMELDIGIF